MTERKVLDGFSREDGITPRAKGPSNGQRDHMGVLIWQGLLDLAATEGRKNGRSGLEEFVSHWCRQRVFDVRSTNPNCEPRTVAYSYNAEAHEDDRQRLEQARARAEKLLGI